MCGINGIYGLNDEFRTRDLLVHMNAALSHRGPDGQGIFTRGRIGLGHRRLSIIDLSENGRQPMLNSSGNIAIAFNGEIYNFKKLRSECRNYEFKSNTDTEVILALYEKYGEGFAEHLDGMFAIAIWDDREKKLILARDRMGKKPLYYTWAGDVLIFSSEIRGILASKCIEPKISKTGLAAYLQYQTVYSPETILQDVHMLEAASILRIQDKIAEKRKFWNIDRAKEKFTLTGPYDKVVKQTRELFFQSVEKRMISDVPLGAFLSGGIDSSCVVAAMSALSQQSVKTFNVSFTEAGFDESSFANEVARKFKTDHQTIQISGDDFLGELPGALAAMDHPGVDGPNSYVVSKYTRNAGVTVALSGLGGDELFGGYPVFKNLKSMSKWRKLKNIPVPARKWIIKMLRNRFSPSQLEKLFTIAETKDLDWLSVYPVFRSVYSDNTIKSLGFTPQSFHFIEGDPNDTFKMISEISIAECKTYLENVLLRDTDQMSMASSLEVRVPFLDKDLLEFVFSLPDDFKPLQPPKKLIIDSMADLLPESIWNRPKMGFTFPWKHWVNNELQAFCAEQLQSFKEKHLLNEAFIFELEQTLTLPENDRWFEVWNLAVLNHWMDKNGVQCK